MESTSIPTIQEIQEGIANGLKAQQEMEKVATTLLDHDPETDQALQDSIATPKKKKVKKLHESRRDVSVLLWSLFHLHKEIATTIELFLQNHDSKPEAERKLYGKVGVNKFGRVTARSAVIAPPAPPPAPKLNASQLAARNILNNTKIGDVFSIQKAAWWAKKPMHVASHVLKARPKIFEGLGNGVYKRIS